MELEGPQPCIAPLPPDEVSKIAAGEVVERPLNVVKELVENALDAGAREITVELEDGGKQLIRVSDDGRGIPADELPLALLPHHTSKIRRLDDIYHLHSLGFRGEALHAISAISKLALTSRAVGALQAGRIEAEAGAVVASAPANLQRGTEVEVRELFFNTPVRRKFLRSKQAETSLVARLLLSYALAYPEIRFRLDSSGRTLLDSGGSRELAEVLADLLGPELAGELVPVHYEFPPAGVHGYVSAPQSHRLNRSRQWYFVNRRPVANKLLYKAVDDAVREYLSPGKYPACVLYLDLPPEELDVNVHPMKTEVNFAQLQAVHSLLVTAVRRALGAHRAEHQRKLTRGLAAVVQPVAAERPAAILPAADPTLWDGGDDDGRDAPPGHVSLPVYHSGEPVLLEPATPVAPAAAQQAARVEIPFPGKDSHWPPLRAAPPLAAIPATAPPAAVAADAGFEALPEYSGVAVAQAADSYLVVATPEAVYLVDQHAAHERLLFDALYEGVRAGSRAGAPRQVLLFPLTVPLSPDEALLAGELAEALYALGLAAVLTGAELMVSEVPAALAGLFSAELVHGLLEDLATELPPALLEEQVKHAAASLACHAALKANHRLTPAERRELVGQLLAGANGLSCPHGRPLVLRLGRGELANLFLR